MSHPFWSRNHKQKIDYLGPKMAGAGLSSLSDCTDRQYFSLSGERIRREAKSK